MSLKPSRDIVPFARARAQLPELLDAVEGGATKLLTRHGDAVAALIDVRRLDVLLEVEAEQRLVKSALKSVEDIAAGRVMNEKTFFAEVERDLLARKRKRRG